MIHLATYFDRNYLSRGLVLYDSLAASIIDFELYVLCLDEYVFNFFGSNKKRFPNVKTIMVKDLEAFYPELETAKSNRKTIEYYFTLSPYLPLYILEKFGLPHICTLDADILFLSSPQFIFDYLKEYAIIITPHKFSKEIMELERFGKYNVSFQIFKNNETGIKCLKLWKEKCFDWCCDYFDEANNRFADQKYLDEWQDLFAKDLMVLKDEVSGIAPWNLNNYVVSSENEDFTCNGKPMVFFHFHHFKIFSKKWATNGFGEYKVIPQKSINELYAYYWKKIDFYNNELQLESDKSARLDLSKKLIPKLLREKKLFKRNENNELHTTSFRYIPKFIRKLIIKSYA